MVFPLKQWLRRLKFVLLLAAITYAVYHVYDVVAAWIEPDKYREPGGRAVKAFRDAPPGAPEAETAWERLQLFYWYGE